MKSIKLSLALLLSLCFVATSTAQDEEMKKQDPRAKAVKQLTNQMMKTFGKAELTDEQKEKAVALIDAHIDGVIEARTALNETVSKEKRKARDAAVKAAKEEGVKNRKKITQMGMDAMELTDDEMAAYKEAKANVGTATKSIRNAIADLLTEEQATAMAAKKNNEDVVAEFKTVKVNLPGMT